MEEASISRAWTLKPVKTTPSLALTEPDETLPQRSGDSASVLGLSQNLFKLFHRQLLPEIYAFRYDLAAFVWRQASGLEVVEFVISKFLEQLFFGHVSVLHLPGERTAMDICEKLVRGSRYYFKSSCFRALYPQGYMELWISCASTAIVSH